MPTKKKKPGSCGSVPIKRVVDFGCTTCGRALTDRDQVFTNNGGCCSQCLQMYRDKEREFTICPEN